MKKLLFGAFVLCVLAPTANAKRSVDNIDSKSFSSLYTTYNGKTVFGKFFNQYVGRVQDPLIPGLYYQLYATTSPTRIAFVNLVNFQGYPQPGSATVSGTYSHTGTVYYSTGTITRSDNTTFTFSHSEDIA
ncbi:hypothetical protein ACFQZX_05420 [Mucilaginibacter litoreus]|uniref:Uncharacterized protein n=1 Tax=Mucilaginibacter litoreus TaxID=1048221 RepID=A0ABW3APT1_9SPHI